MTANKPKNEEERLKALNECQILDTLAEDEYDTIVQIAAHICDTPISLISLIDQDRQWFKAKHGIDIQETERNLAFCAHAILNPEEPLVVEDASNDSRFKDNELVTGEPKIRFYAGYPLTDNGEYAFGTLCVIDTHPKILSQTQKAALASLSKYVVSLMQLNRHRIAIETLTDIKIPDIIQEKKDAEKANQLKSEFLSVIGHELRTPIHSILNLTRLCEESIELGNKGEQKQNLDYIKLSSERLLYLINDLLDIAKLESGKAIFNFEKADIEAVITRCFSEMKALAHEKNITLNLKKIGENIITVELDRLKMQQVLVNLISNAIKFSPEHGSISVICESNDSALHVSVIDAGEGIPAGEEETVFDKFIQSSRSNKSKGGTGLGLAICKEIIEYHHGRIWAENLKQANGAAFRFSIPLQQPESTSHI